MMKKLGFIATGILFLVSILAVAASAALVPVQIDKVWINGREVVGSEVRGDVFRGNTIEVEVKLVANGTLSQDTEDILSDNIKVRAEIDGDEHEDIEDETESFELKAGQSYFKTLTLRLPDNLDQDRYLVRIEVTGRRDAKVTKDVMLDINTARHAVNIEDVLFSPGMVVKAGRTLSAEVRVENNGEKDEENVKVELAVDGVGSTFDYIDEVEEEEEEMSEQLFLRVPECADAKDYRGRVTVWYDEKTRSTSQDFTLTVLENEACKKPGSSEERTVIAVPPEGQNIIAGGNEAGYPIQITNAGRESRTYTVQLTTGDWAATSRVSPQNVLTIDAGKTAVAYVYVSAKDTATAGDKLLGVTVKSGDETLKEVSLRANVVPVQPRINIKQGLQYALGILIVVLVVIGLVIGLSRMKGDEEGKEETYY